LWTVISFTFGNKVRTKSFIITSVILALVLTLGIHIPYLISLFASDEADRIGVFEDPQQIALALKAQAEAQPDSDLVVVVYPDPGREAQDGVIREALENDDLRGFLVFTPAEGGGFPAVTYKSESTMEFGIASRIQTILMNIKTEMALQDLQLTDAQKQQLFSPINIQTEQISAGGGDLTRSESEMFMAYGMVYVLMIMLFMAIMISGQMIATEITNEKSSRVMEILVTSVAPLTQMFGKIIGMLLLGLSQVLFYIVVGAINLNLPHNKEAFGALNINLGDIDARLLVYFIIFYLLGYFLYATLYAGVGSIVSRMEDLGQAVMPITLLALAAFYIGIYGLNDPTSTFTTAMSYVPFFTPLIMFLRIGMADPAWWEIAVSIALLAVSIYVFGWLAAKIYRTGVLMYGKRPSFKELRKAMKAFKV
jgi:ABC-2 type transport system permease protein